MSDSPLLSEKSITVVAKALYEHDSVMRGFRMAWKDQDAAVKLEYMGKAEAATRAIFGLYTRNDDWADHL